MRGGVARKAADLGLTAIRELSGGTLKPLPPPPQPRARSRASNVERLVSAAVEMLQTFGQGGFADLAAGEIRKATNETTAAQALKRLHDLTAPPYS